MPTTPEEKPAKPRTKSRKTDQRNPKKTQSVADQVKREADPVIADPVGANPVSADPVSAMTVPIEPAPVEVAEVEAVPTELAPAEFVSEQATSEQAAPDVAPVAAVAEKAQEKPDVKTGVALSGEVLPPEVHRPASQPAGLSGIALAYGEYTRNSWISGRFLVERLTAMRSFDEAVEIQGEFAKQVYSNFVVQSQKICVLYGEWAQQFFRPFADFTALWPRIGR